MPLRDGAQRSLSFSHRIYERSLICSPSRSDSLPWPAPDPTASSRNGRPDIAGSNGFPHHCRYTLSDMAAKLPSLPVWCQLAPSMSQDSGCQQDWASSAMGFTGTADGMSGQEGATGQLAALWMSGLRGTQAVSPGEAIFRRGNEIFGMPSLAVRPRKSEGAARGDGLTVSEGAWRSA